MSVELVLISCLIVGGSPRDPLVLPAPPGVPLAQSDELFGLEPLEGPFQGGELNSVFVRGDDALETSAVYAEYRELAPPEPTSVEGIRTALRGVSARLESSASFTTDNGKVVRQRVLRHVQLLSMSLAAFEPQTGVWAAVRDDPRTGRALWQPGDLDVSASGLESQLVYFQEDADDAFALVAWRDVDPDERIDNRYFTYTSPEEAFEIRSAVDLVFHLLDREFPIGDIEERLARNDAAWTNYLQNGYSQYPWELLLNSSAVSSSWDDPPRSQFVLLHPEPAVLVGAESADEAELELAVLVHVLGYVRYFGDDRDWFLGLSSSLCVSDDDELGLGYGGTLHFGSGALGSSLSYLSAGLFYQEGTDDLSVAVTVDAWKFLANPDVDQLIDLFVE